MSTGRMLRYALCVMIAFAALGWGTLAMAAGAGPEAFYGRYQGSGVTQSPNLAFLGLDTRDLDVQIGPDGNGFFVEWTTVIRDVADRETRRNAARISFEPSGRPGIYLERAAASRVADGLSWATVQDGSLIIRVLAILDNGAYDIQTYERSLTEKGMFLYFRSDRDGQTVRFVTASLKKVE